MMKSTLVIAIGILMISSAEATRTLNVEAGPFPNGANRCAIVIDGRNVSPIRETVDIPRQSSNVQLTMSVPEQVIRVRAVAFSGIGAFPTIVAVGHLNVSSPTTTSVYIELMPLVATIDPSSDNTHLGVDVLDPAEIISRGEVFIFWTSDHVQNNAQGATTIVQAVRSADHVRGTLVAQSNGKWFRSWQLAYYAREFGDDIQTPTFFFPDKTPKTGGDQQLRPVGDALGREMTGSGSASAPANARGRVQGGTKTVVGVRNGRLVRVERFK